MKKILHITPDFNYSCGRSKLVYLYLKHFNQQIDYETHFITNGGDSLERLREFPSLKFEELNFSTGLKNIFYGGSFYRKLKEYLINNKIDLVHTHHRFPELISNLIAKSLNVKTVFSTHGYVKGHKALSFKSDKIISVSNSVTSYLIEEFKINIERIETFYNPMEFVDEINREKINSLKNETGISVGEKVLLFMGRINKEKGCDTLIKSFNIVKNMINDVVLLFSGDIEDKNILSEIGNRNDIKILTPNKNSINLFSTADIVILPSRTESFPFVMVEAGSYKKPFIGGKIGGIVEFIEDNKNGLLIDPEDYKQLSEKIIYLLKNPEVGNILGNNLHKKVSKFCNQENYFVQVEKIYNSLLLRNDF
jgi:glycosyltransferase involved in cell wall biosynthesis